MPPTRLFVGGDACKGDGASYIRYVIKIGGIDVGDHVGQSILVCQVFAVFQGGSIRAEERLIYKRGELLKDWGRMNKM